MFEGFLTVLAALVLAVVAAATWDGLKWSWQRMVPTIFRAVTLDSKRWRDKAFAEAARGEHGLSSLYVHLYLVGFLGFLAVLAMAVMLARAISSTGIKSLPMHPAIELIALVVAFAFLLDSSFSSFRHFFFVNQANVMAAWARQSISVVCASISIQQERELRSQFAQIQNEEDFQVFRTRLESIAEERNLKLPEGTF